MEPRVEPTMRIWETRGAPFASALRLPKLSLRGRRNRSPDRRYEGPGLGIKPVLAPEMERRLDMADPTDVDMLFVRPVREEPTEAASAEPQTAHSPASTFTVSELDRISFSVDAGKDPVLTYDATGLPRHATFNPIDRMFTWRPRPGQDGTWAITFTATDAEGTVSTIVVRINVRPLEPAVLHPSPKQIEL